MVTFPNAKINIGLNITEKRPDNYHNLESVFYPIPIKDILEIVESKDNVSRLHLSGLSIDGDLNDNLIMKAYRLLSQDFKLPAIDIYLDKIIPFGAGIGGGSADAAFTLKMLNEMFELGLDDMQLEGYAAKIGADCAFFIKNQPALATGIGNILEPLEFSMKGVYFVLIKPDVYISTKAAYSMVSPQKPVLSLKEMVSSPIQNWKGNILNDFEKSVFPQFPIIENIKRSLYEQDAIYASMSGSGSSVYGFFKQPVDVSDEFPDMYVFQCTL